MLFSWCDYYQRSPVLATAQQCSSLEGKLLGQHTKYTHVLVYYTILTWHANILYSFFFFKWSCIHVQLCLTLCYPVDYSLPSSSVHGILQAILE